MRRAWANRRVSEKATTLSNIQALLVDNPPVSALINKPKLASDMATPRENRSPNSIQAVKTTIPTQPD